MQKYRHKLDISQEYADVLDRKISLEEFGKIVADKLRAIPDEETFSTSFFKSGVEGAQLKAWLIGRLDNVRMDGLRDLNQIIDYLYDWGDVSVAEFRGLWQRRCQVITQ